MYKKAFQNVFTVFMVVAMLTATIGCDLGQRQAPVSSDAGVLEGVLSATLNPPLSTEEPINQPLFSTDLPSGRLDIQAVAIDSLDKTVTLTLTHHTSGTSNSRYLSMQFYETDSNAVGVRHILTDSDGGLLWEFDYSVDTTDKNHWWFSERTLFDEMTVVRWSGPDFTKEMYTINGNSRTFHFNTSDVEKLRLLHDTVHSGNSLTGLSIEDAEIVATLRAFDEFYVSDNTLHNSDDGTLLFEVLTNDALAGWLSAEYVGGDDQPLYRPRWADWVCTASAVCSAIKCTHPNPACPACLAVVITCVLMEFFNLW